MTDLLNTWQYPSTRRTFGTVAVDVRRVPTCRAFEVLFPTHFGVTVSLGVIGEEGGPSVRTSFWDGKAFSVRPNTSPGALETLRQLGYPEDAEGAGAWEFCWEHEVLRGLTMRWLGWPFSPVARESALRGEPWNALGTAWEMGHAAEELTVLRLQRYLKDDQVPSRGDDPPLWLIVDLSRREPCGFNWPALGMAARALLEEVRKMMGEP